jgi:hypothetical protein
MGLGRGAAEGAVPGPGPRERGGGRDGRGGMVEEEGSMVGREEGRQAGRGMVWEQLCGARPRTPRAGSWSAQPSYATTPLGAPPPLSPHSIHPTLHSSLKPPFPRHAHSFQPVPSPSFPSPAYSFFLAHLYLCLPALFPLVQSVPGIGCQPRRFPWRNPQAAPLRRCTIARRSAVRARLRRGQHRPPCSNVSRTVSGVASTANQS